MQSKLVNIDEFFSSIQTLTYYAFTEASKFYCILGRSELSYCLQWNTAPQNALFNPVLQVMYFKIHSSLKSYWLMLLNYCFSFVVLSMFTFNMCCLTDKNKNVTDLFARISSSSIVRNTVIGNMLLVCKKCVKFLFEVSVHHSDATITFSICKSIPI